MRTNMNTRSWIEVDVKALAHNVRAFKRIAGAAALMALVKSNAYGHGLVEVSKVFLKHGASWLGVDSLEEAMILREHNITHPILILGHVPIAGLGALFKHALRTSVYDMGTLKALDIHARKRGAVFPVHLKIETGTNRQGILPDEIESFLKYILQTKHLALEGVSTHFADAEDALHLDFSRTQLGVFNNVLKRIQLFNITPRYIHCAATAATLVFPESRFNLVRPGIGLYGLWPSEETKAFIRRHNGFAVRPALSWKVRIVQLKKVKKGSSIGYGLSERVKRDSIIAVLPVGYWDGYDRKLSSRGEVLLGGRRSKVLGYVCMNMTMVDVTDMPFVRSGDVAVLLGKDKKEEVSAEELAEKIGTINYEILARINPLLPRIYI